MPRPGLMKMRGTVIDKTCLSSDVASISFTHFSNSPHPSLKYDIQFFVIEITQNRLQRLEKLILVSQLTPFEFFFDCRKQVEVTRARVGEQGGCGIPTISCSSSQSVETQFV
jgi:hypothetical protein